MAATTRKKSAPKKSSTASKPGAGAAVAERSKDADKKAFGKAAPKTVKPAAAAKSKTMKPAKKASEDGPSIASRVIRKVKKTASGAVAMAGSVIGRRNADSKG